MNWINGMIAFGIGLIAGCSLFLVAVLWNSYGAKDFRKRRKELK